MKNHLEIGHLTKFDTFKVNSDKVMDLEIWFKIHTNFSNFETASPKTIKTLKIFHQFCHNCKIPSCNFYLKEAEMKIAMFAHFKDYEGNNKNFRSLYGFGGRCLQIRDVCMDFEPYFKVHNLDNVHPKNIKLGQITNRDMIIYVMVSDYRLAKI